MGSAEKFCLRWNDFESNISTAFRELREDKDFFDVTLVCDEGQIQAHKVILSACSPFFRTVLKTNPHQHPLLYLKSVKYTDLLSVLNFMYHGEVNVAQDELNSFLSIAEDLKVKGLTKNNSESYTHNAPRLKQRQTDPPERPKPTPEQKRARPVDAAAPQPIPSLACYQEPYHDIQDDIQEVIPVKSEPVSLHQDQTQHLQSQVAVDSMYEDTDYGDYDTGYEETTEHEHAYGGEMVNRAAPTHHHTGAAQSNPSSQDRANMFLVNMTMVMDGAVKKWQCVLCGKMAKLKADILDHVEAKHMDNSFLYNCRYCSKVLNTNGNLRTHEHRCTEKHVS